VGEWVYPQPVEKLVCYPVGEWETSLVAKGQPEVRVDVATVVTAGLSAIAVIGTFKLLAIKFNKHPLAKAFNLLF
jgi:hypothetical protein